jgi:hypothetical protein
MPKSRKPTSKAIPPLSEVQIESGAKELQPTEKEKTSPQPVGQVPRFTASKDYISVYSNHPFFKVNTIWDITIDLGQVKGVQDNQLVVENRISVTMPLAVAKLLAMGIQANLQQFEKQTGKSIDLPPTGFTQVKVSPDTKNLEAKESTEQK